MAITYKLIASTTVPAGGQASITFSTIPQTYTDLVIRMSSRSETNSIKDNLRIDFNGSSSNWTAKMIGAQNVTLQTSEEGATYANTHNYTVNAGTSTALVYNNHETYITGYTTSYNKSSSSDSAMEINSTDNQMGLFGNNWADSAAITTITLYMISGNDWAQHTTAYLYGISNV